MPWCRWVAPSGCSVRRGHFPGCFMAFSHELNVCGWPPVFNITAVPTLAKCLASLKVENLRAVGVLGQKLSDVYSMAKQRWAEVERSWCTRPSASQSSALIGKREGIPGSAINDNNTITCHGDECFVELTSESVHSHHKQQQNTSSNVTLYT